jgi:peptide/nickel transport system substrate-binding protein
LDQAGWKPGPDGIRVKDGKKLQISLVNSFTQELAPLVQAQMKEIGIDATIEQVPGPIQLERAASGDFNLLIQHMAYSDPGVLDMLYNSRNNKAGGWAWTRYLDPKLDQLLNDSDVTIDPQKRCDLLTQAQQIIAQNAIVLPYYGSYSIMVTNANVKDLNYGPRTTVEVWIQDAYVQK